jgi:hypothetical protein
MKARAAPRTAGAQPPITLIAAGQRFDFSRKILAKETALMELCPGTFNAPEYQVQTGAPLDTFRDFLLYLEEKALPKLTDQNTTHLTQLAEEFGVASLKELLADSPATSSGELPPSELSESPAAPPAASHPDIAVLLATADRLSREIAECAARLATVEAGYRSIPDLYQLIEESRCDDTRVQKLESDLDDLKKTVERIGADSRQFISIEQRKLDAAAESQRAQQNAQAESLSLQQSEFLSRTTASLSSYRSDVAQKFSALDSLVGTFRSEYSGRIERTFPYSEQRPLSGILRHIGVSSGLVEVTSSFRNADPLRCARNVIDLDSLRDFITDDEAGQWVCFDFRPSSVRLDGYAIVGANTLFPRNWAVEVSWDGSAWTEVDARANAADLNQVSQVCHFATAHPFEGRFVRFTQTGRNSGGGNVLQMRALELFGTYRDIDSDGVEARMRKIEQNIALVRARPVCCLQHAGMPLRGIVRFLADRNRGNLHEQKVVEVRGTMPMGELKSIVDPNSRAVVVLLPDGQEPPTLAIDFKERKVVATHFGVEIGDPNQNQPRAVVIQGFDGKEWRTLCEVGNLAKQCAKGLAGVCPVAACIEASQFRIQHKETKNREMGIVGFEVFGTFFE